MKNTFSLLHTKSIRGRMFFALMLVVVVVIIIVNFVMFRLISEITDQDALRGMGNSAVAYQHFDDQRRELLTTQARAMAQTALLKATLEIEGLDRETISFAGRQLQAIANSELLLILGDTGQLLADIHNPDVISADTSQFSGIDRALDGDDFYGVWEYESYNYHIAISPSTVGNRIVGLVVLGQRLDSNEAMRLIEEVTGSELILSLNNEIYALAPEVAERNESMAGLLASVADQRAGELIGVIEGVEIRKVTTMGGTQFTATIVFPDFPGVMVFYRSIDLIAAALWPFQQSVIASSGLIFLFGLFISRWITTRFSKPITKLTELTKEFGQGNFELRLEPESEDEVGTLTESFNSMADDITVYRKSLIESKELAEAANHAKGEFLATMSHEIRSPMNGVMGITELLMRTELDETQQKYVSMLMKSSENLLDIIDNILDFSKIESGNLQLEQFSFDLREHLDSLAKSYANLAYQKGLELICTIPPDESFDVCGDPERLKQILVNLIGNAIKFTGEGSIQVAVRTTDKKDMLLFEVSDTGIGIKPELQETIFQPFSQTDNSTTREYGGTGLGLSICEKLVLLMGGSMGCESSPGNGAKFWFTARLPIVRTGSTEVLMPNPALNATHVLIVDDNAINRTSLQHQFEIWGMRPQCASTGVEALGMLKNALGGNDGFDLVLLDVVMPDMDGLAVVDAIRAEPQLDELKLLMLSTDSNDPKLIELERNGLAQCLSKPICQVELFTSLHSVMNEVVLIEKGKDSSRNSDLSQAAFSAQVLVIDDHGINLELARAKLELMGCDVDVAISGEEGIKAINARPYDMVFMDCQMPGKDGFETTREIRRLEKAQHVKLSLPIIALTANAIKGDRDRCLAAGMNGYLSKPFKQEELAVVLERWLDVQENPIGSEISHIPIQSAEPVDVLDHCVLSSIRDLSNDKMPNPLAVYTEIFLRNTPDLISSIKAAVESGDHESVIPPAHSLISYSGHLGAKSLEARCREMHELGRSRQMTGANDVWIELNEQYTKAVTALKQECGMTEQVGFTG